MDKLPYAEHLNQEEVDYELLIRGELGEEIGEVDLASKQRHLRTLFKSDSKNMKNYPSPYNIMEEYDYIDGRLTDLVKALKRGFEQRYVSRLLHYYYRAKRCLSENPEENKLKRDLIRRIGECMKEYKVGPPASPTVQQINSMLNEADRVDLAQALPTETVKSPFGRVAEKKQTTSTPEGTPKYTGTTPKIQGGDFGNAALSKSAEVENADEDRKVMQQKIDHLERMLESVTKLLLERESHEVHQERNQQNERSVGKLHNSGLFTRPNSGSSDEEDNLRHLKSNRHYAVARDQQQGARNSGRFQDHYESEDGRESRVSEGSRRSVGRRINRVERRREDGIRDHINRVEKWKLRFSGDSRSVTVENFLYKLKKIAEREGVSDQQLLRDIHLLLEGPASDWFFTFVDELNDWETFERLIKYRFGNPNQDQGIRQKIHDRKQLRGESFIAFVTEIEKLNRMLSKPLSNIRKFEVIWDNMRQHYRSKISIVDVQDLQQLVKLNHRIDAADPNLHQMGEPRRSVNAVEAEESDYDSDESATINSMRPRQTKPNKPSTPQHQFQQSRGTSQPTADNMDSTAQRNCWNCQQPGHSWRECRKPKVIFCYGCGNLGRTIRCCERCSATNRFSTDQGN